MKKGISLILSLLMLFSVIMPVSAATNGNEVWVSSATGKPGDTVQIGIALGHFRGIASLKLSVEFDENNISLIDINYSTSLPGETQLPETLSNPATLNWHDVRNFNGNCDFATLTFKINNDAAPGEYTIRLGVYQRDTFGFGADGSIIPYEFPMPYDGVITVDSDVIAVTSISLNQSTLNLDSGETSNLRATITPNDATDKSITWLSTNESVATVDANGRVTAVGDGTAKIIAISGTMAAQCKVNVTSPHKHTYNIRNTDSYYQASDASCDTRATYYYSCDCGSKGTDTFVYGFFDEHIYGEWVTVTPPTDTEDGLSQRICSVCNNTEDKILTSTTHSHLFDQKVISNTYCKSIASCQAKAIYYYSCSCGAIGTETFEHGEYASHSLVRNAAKKATCTENGNILYFECRTCHKLFSDSSAENEISSNDIPIQFTGHDYSVNWSWDALRHWHECLACGDIIDSEPHIPGPAATETTDQTCTECGFIITPAFNHSHIYDSAWKSDKTGHWRLCSCGDKSTVMPHTPGSAATETTPQTCTECNYVIVPALGHVHDYTSEWKYNPSGHWKECVCGDTLEVVPHTPSTPATETTPQLCTVCNYVIAPALGVQHNTNFNWSSDSTGHWHDCSCGFEHDKRTHSESDWIIDIKATANRDGTRHKECIVCGYVIITETIPATGSIYDEDFWYWYLMMIYSQEFNVTASASEGGVVSPAGTSKVKYDKSITYTITPDVDYVIKSVLVDGKDIGAVSEYTFKNVTKKHTIHAIFEKVNPYTDVKADNWFYDDVLYVTAIGLMEGTGNGKFSPEITTDRAMLVTVLWRLEGCPVVDSPVDFFDVSDGLWYSDAIDWASANGIVNGYGDGRFGPTDKITREQIAAILNRYATYKKLTDGTTLPIIAQYMYNEWAENNVIWAENNGLLEGLGVDLSDMTAKASRAELAAYLSRFMKNIIK